MICDHYFAVASAYYDGHRNVDDCDIDGDGKLIDHDRVDRFAVLNLLHTVIALFAANHSSIHKQCFYGSSCSFCVYDK